MTASPAPDPEGELVRRALSGDKLSISSLVSLFEDQRESAGPRRLNALSALERRGCKPKAVILGFTGTPGSGKSSLLARLTLELLAQRQHLSVAVLAVDPSSHVSGGALLGDRTRMRLPHAESRLFFRSQASATALGGLAPHSFQVCRLLAHLFDCVFVETVGIGQSEADIRHLADRVYLVLQPLGGDEIQFFKAGIMEIPHAFVLNKSDEPSSDKSYHALKSTLWLSRPFDADQVSIFRTSAKTGAGLAELATDLLATIESPSGGFADKQRYFFERWVREEWGRFGVSLLEGALGGPAGYLATSGGFDRALLDFEKRAVEAFVTGRRQH
jgi:LAO/AO transport system kinase